MIRSNDELKDAVLTRIKGLIRSDPYSSINARELYLLYYEAQGVNWYDFQFALRSIRAVDLKCRAVLRTTIRDRGFDVVQSLRII